MVKICITCNGSNDTNCVVEICILMAKLPDTICINRDLKFSVVEG